VVTLITAGNIVLWTITFVLFHNKAPLVDKPAAIAKLAGSSATPAPSVI